jgi:hypothetical protein
MYFDTKDPAKLFPATAPEKAQAVNKPGWAVQIRGISTNPQLATWLEETLKPALEKSGREPARGIYIDQVVLSKVASKSASLKEAPVQVGGGDEAPATGRVRGRVSLGGDTGGGEESSGPLTRGGRGGGEPETAPAGGSPADSIGAWRERLKTEDALTGEKTTDDQRFIIYVIVRKGDTPQNMIPDEFKPKKAEPEKGKAGEKGSAPPAKNPKG